MDVSRSVDTPGDDESFYWMAAFNLLVWKSIVVFKNTSLGT